MHIYTKGTRFQTLVIISPIIVYVGKRLIRTDARVSIGNTLREVEMLINDSEWEDKIKVKDSEIARLTNIINTKCYKCGDCDKFGSNCSAGDVDGNEDCRACKKFVSKEVSALRKLVNELADELSKFHAWEETRALVERAREMTK